MTMRVRSIVAVLIGVFAVLTLLDRFVLVELLVRRTTLPLLLATLVAFASVAVGALVRRTRSIDLPFDFLVGYPLFGTLCFFVGTIRVSSATMLGLVFAGAAAGIWLSWQSRGDAPLSMPPAHWSAIVVALVLACAFVTAQAPPSSLDELAYHLAVPHVWALEGRAVELPLLSHSYFPLGIESADVPLLVSAGATSGGIASHFLHLFAAFATTLLIARRSKSWLVTAAIVTTPALALTAGWSLVDWPLLGLFVALYISLEEDAPTNASAATAAGLLTKYTFVPFAIVAWALKRQVPRWPALLGLTFFVRNALLTGNPVAPFFSSDAPHVAGYRASALADYIFEGVFVDEALGASILILPLLGSGAIAAAAGSFAIVLFLLGPSSRILVPFLAIPALSAAPHVRQRLVRGVIGVAIVLQAFLVVWFTARSETFELIAGTATEEEYLRKQRRTFATVEALNAALGPESRTLVVGMSETYWFTRPTRGGGNFDAERVSRYLSTGTPEALRERLRRDGITHVAVFALPPPTNVERKKEERQANLSPAAQRMLSQMIDRYAAAVTPAGDATLFTIR